MECGWNTIPKRKMLLKTRKHNKWNVGAKSTRQARVDPVLQISPVAVSTLSSHGLRAESSLILRGVQ